METGIAPIIPPREQFAVAVPPATPVAVLPLTERMAELELDQEHKFVTSLLGPLEVCSIAFRIEVPPIVMLVGVANTVILVAGGHVVPEQVTMICCE